MRAKSTSRTTSPKRCASPRRPINSNRHIQSPCVLGLPRPKRAAGESRQGEIPGRPPKVKGSWVMGRISQAKGPRAGGRPGEFDPAHGIDADGVTLSGLGTGRKTLLTSTREEGVQPRGAI